MLTTIKKLVLSVFLVAPGLLYAGPLETGLAAYKRSDYSTALEIFKPLAITGNAVAQRHLALSYATGQGLPKDDKRAVFWGRKAADQGDAAAQSMLGEM